ncbi:proto-oncogene tyrosine- kinase Src-like [Brachionus plicatilis]|uniref:Proto-oncogene tyrosine-kinase Src-like n=1 Tax=Brachionus plicatilis TaxID=10195 RepID=A0A3M7Q3U4_BRAPC|nr:proto-oncogene tyrosine- kinase Src-like [Brachionus plicatilis]
MISFSTKRWFFPNTSRREAERLLEYLDNEPGVFLIRESEQDNGKCWSLSILDYNEEKQRHTKHYRIRKIDSGGCYISTRNRFNSLDELCPMNRSFKKENFFVAENASGTEW